MKWPFPHITPRDVQLEALEKAEGHEGFAFFMRQRLGKTYTTIAEYTLLAQQDKVDWLFVICPNSLKQQWLDAITEADLSLPVCVYESQNKAKVDKYFEKVKSGAFIINYESLVAFMRAKIYDKFDCSRVYLVADESTKIKDHTAKSAKAALALSAMCGYKRVLSGRPMANSLADMWTQLRFIGATERNFYQHRATFCILGGFQGRQVVRNINEDILKKEMEPYSYIAPDKYIKGFKKIYEPIIEVELTKELSTHYKQMQEALFIELTCGTEITAPIALVKYMRLQQISSGIAGDEERRQHNLVEPNRNPRIRETINLLDNIDGKVIIVCRFRLSIENLVMEVKKTGRTCAAFTGGMDKEEIEAVKKDFNDGDLQVLVAQTQVLSYGHTLCGLDSNPCSSVIYFENSFSLLDRAQSEARPEKYGRDNTIYYYDISCSKMDTYILNALLKKEDASLALMDYARKYGMRPKEEFDELQALLEDF